ncbi:hypothetical protein RIF29_24199 [Crotalaria pallida]|uniref:Uncharacterized protein n=1 Tax=Crotalaria pallida TaxID=3830 RepID=A0AAN9ERI4_CROPI
MFPSLQHLWIHSNCTSNSHISDECFSTLLTSLSNLRILRHLFLQEHHFTFVPLCITELHSLKELHLFFCNDLVEIRWIPPNLEELYASECNSLKYLDLTSSPCLLRTLHLNNCNALEEIRGIPPTIQVLSATNCPSLTDSCRRMLLNQIKFKDNVDQLVLLENEWNHAEFSFHAYDDIYGKPEQLANTQIGLHVFKQESSSMKDIRFTSPYEIERNDDDDDDDDDDRDSNSTEKSPIWIWKAKIPHKANAMVADCLTKCGSRNLLPFKKIWDFHFDADAALLAHFVGLANSDGISLSDYGLQKQQQLSSTIGQIFEGGMPSHPGFLLLHLSSISQIFEDTTSTPDKPITIAEVKSLVKDFASRWQTAIEVMHFFQQFLMWYGDSNKGCIDSVVALLYQTLILHQEDRWWFCTEQGSCFHIFNHV